MSHVSNSQPTGRGGHATRSHVNAKLVSRELGSLSPSPCAGREPPDDGRVSFLLAVVWSRQWGQPQDLLDN